MNAGSGSRSDNDALERQVADAFAAHGLEPIIKLASGGRELLTFAEEFAKQDHDVIVAGGGDGTISAIAAEIVGTDKVLGVLPLGTLNHFSKDLKIPQTIEEAVRVIAAGHVADIDVAEVNGQMFLNNSSIGLYPRIVHKRNQQQQRLKRGKWPAAFWATVAMLRRYPFLDIKIKIGDETLKRRTPFVFVGNNEYLMHGFHIGARAQLDDGKLSLYVLHRTGRLGLFILAVRSLFGIIKQAKDFDAFLIEEIEIVTKRKKHLLVAFDGEIMAMRAPLHYKIRPKELKVFVPVTSE